MNMDELDVTEVLRLAPVLHLKVYPLSARVGHNPEGTGIWER